jgi:hypothetical protein
LHPEEIAGGASSNSFTDKKQSGKWILMNSRHIRNKSEIRTETAAAATTKNINSNVGINFNL